MNNSSRISAYNFAADRPRNDSSNFDWALQLLADLSTLFNINSLPDTASQLAAAQELLAMELSDRVVPPEGLPPRETGPHSPKD